MNIKLSVSDIWKSYNGNPVLKGCSFSFDKGSLYVLMGPNGSGKSTFLRICALIEAPDRGHINYFSQGEVLKKDIELRRKITLVLPGVGVFNTTVFQNTAYGLALRGISKKDITERVDKMLEFSGLLHKRNHKAISLSSGELQRLGIARAMAIEPEVIFLDEPTASIDGKNTKIIEDMLLSMISKRSSTVIITTHDILQARRFGANTLFMDKGQIVER